jgi:hypothetical protein
MIGRKGHCRSRSTKVILTATACCVRACRRKISMDGTRGDLQANGRTGASPDSGSLLLLPPLPRSESWGFH